MAGRDDGPSVSWRAPGGAYVVTTIFKHKRLILGSAVLAVAASIVALWLLAPTYEVSASLLFKLAREVKPAVATGVPAGATQGPRPEDITTEVEILRSQFLIEKVVRHFGDDFFTAEPPAQTLVQRIKAAARSLVSRARQTTEDILVSVGLARRLSPSDRVILALQRSLVVEPPNRSDVIRVRLMTPDPDVGVLLLTKFLEIYLEQHLASRMTPKAREFLEGQTGTLQEHLAELERARAEFMRSGGVSSLEEQRRLLLTQRRDMSTALDGTAAEVARLGAEVGGLRQKLAELPSEVRLSTSTQRNPLVDVLRGRLIQLEGKREEMRGRYADTSRMVVDLDREIEEVRKALRAEETYVTQSVTLGSTTSRHELEKELLTKQAALDGLRARALVQARQATALESEIQRLDRAELELRRLEREVAIAGQNYVLYAKNLEEARITEALDLAKISNVSVVAPPTATLTPVAPRKTVMVAGGLLLGLGGSVILAFLLEALRPAVRSRSDVVEILGAPVLATVPDARIYERRD